jgi:hypothetical protein
MRPVSSARARCGCRAAVHQLLINLSAGLRIGDDINKDRCDQIAISATTSGLLIVITVGNYPT